jgi:threonine aldolase
MVMPGLVYISQPTEYGTFYSLEELAALRTACASTLTVRDLRMQ